MTGLTFLLAMTWMTVGSDSDALIGYRQGPIDLVGPADHREQVDPVWVYAYPTLTLRYRAQGIAADESAILTLAPGSVGPVTPGATNPENPFVAGMPVVAIRGRDLTADGEMRTVTINLRDRMRTPQIHELQWTVGNGASLHVEALEFLGGPELLPGEAPALPATANAWKIDGPIGSGVWRGTTLRGEETIQITGESRSGRSFWLAIEPHFATVREFAAGAPADKVRIRESRETADLIARIIYDDGGWEEQFPLSIAERRHTLINRTPAIYALELDPDRPLSKVELLDRSPHVQWYVAQAGIANEPPPASLESLPIASPRDRGQPGPPADVALDFQMVGVPEGTVQAQLEETSEPASRRASLLLKNTSGEAVEFTLTFPRATIRASDDPADVAYLFPKRGTILSTADQTWEAPYNAAFPLQFVDVFAPRANRGAAVIVADTEGRDKTFRLKKAGPTVTAEVDYRVHLKPGESWRVPEVRIATHGGDWREGFAAYRGWLATWYKPAGPRPDWLRRAFWARRDYPVGGTGKLFDVKRGHYTMNSLIHDGHNFGKIDFMDISGWAMSETVGRVGDYPIELGGADDLARNIAQAREQGVPTGLYFEGYLIDRRSAIGKALQSRSQLIGKDGRGVWWSGGEATEFFACPYQPEWRAYLAKRVATVATEVAAAGVYLDEFGFGGKRCFATTHGHEPGIDTLRGEIETAAAVRRELEATGQGTTMLYIEETPPDAAAPYFDAAFCYALPYTDVRQSPLKLNLSRFAFPDIRLWDMVSIGIDPRALPSEDFRLSLWHGDGLWLKGHARTWYGTKLLAWIRQAHQLLNDHAEAFAGPAEPLVESPHPAVFINRFGSGSHVVFTLLNASHRTARLHFQGHDLAISPRDVVVLSPRTEVINRNSR